MREVEWYHVLHGVPGQQCQQSLLTHRAVLRLSRQPLDRQKCLRTPQLVVLEALLVGGHQPEAMIYVLKP